MQPTKSDIPELRYTDPGSPADAQARANCYVINQLNAQYSTGPHTPEGASRCVTMAFIGTNSASV